jgi:hypothetical protein
MKSAEIPGPADPAIILKYTKAEVETMITKFDSLKQRDNVKNNYLAFPCHEGDALPIGQEKS